MNLPRLISLEKSLAAGAVVAVVAALIWWWQEQSGLRRLRAERVGVTLQGAAYARAPLPQLEGTVRSWSEPGPQSAGRDWIYELFTPPVIYYHATENRFTVTPSVSVAEKSRQPFGLELLSVRREPFRLQLVGYVGAPGDYIGTFVSTEIPQTLLGRAGTRFVPLGLVLKSVEIRRVNLAPSDAAPVYGVVGFAVLHDERSGAEVTLNTRQPNYTDAPVAVLRAVAEADGQPRVLREGDTIEQTGASFRIERIQFDPPEVVVGKTTAGLPYPEMHVLKPAAAADTSASRAAAIRTLLSPSETKLAAAEQPHR